MWNINVKLLFTFIIRHVQSEQSMGKAIGAAI
jgi:hypothetical protein